MRQHLKALSVLCLATLGGCAANSTSSSPSGNQGPVDNAAVIVINRSNWDMDVYLVRGGQRSRIGLAPAGKTTRYSLTPAQYVGGGPIRIVAQPLVSGSAVSSEPLTLNRGEAVTLDIPPQ
jgi:hypothetical protein